MTAADQPRTVVRRPDLEAKPPRLRTVFEILGWIVAVAIAVVASFLIVLGSHFDCGGTLGGYGESASARLDQECYAARSWRAVIPFVILGAAVTLRVTAGRRHKRRRRDR